MKHIPLFTALLIGLFVWQPLSAALQDDLRLLDDALAKKPLYDKQKEERIHELESHLPLTFDDV